MLGQLHLCAGNFTAASVVLGMGKTNIGFGPLLLNMSAWTPQGVGPNLVRELCEAASVDPQLLPRELEESEWAALYAQWRAWLQTVILGNFRPAVNPSTGRISVLGAGFHQATSVHALVDDALRGTQVRVICPSLIASVVARQKNLRALI